jgi:hypothetical protein
VNALLLNRDGFQMPADGWYQIAPVGEFAHAQAGVVQVVVDREACEAMVNRFQAEAEAQNFAGLLVDFDHFSLDGEKRSEAAGWIVALEARDEVSGVGVQVSKRATRGSRERPGVERACELAERIVRRFTQERPGWSPESAAMKHLKLVVLAEVLRAGG